MRAGRTAPTYVLSNTRLSTGPHALLRRIIVLLALPSLMSEAFPPIVAPPRVTSACRGLIYYRTSSLLRPVQPIAVTFLRLTPPARTHRTRAHRMRASPGITQVIQIWISGCFCLAEAQRHQHGHPRAARIHMSEACNVGG